MKFIAGKVDIAVIGAGHAGAEAALAAARLGAKTAIFTLNLDSVGNLPCNPSIGGPGKSQIVREIDALGGEMGRAADACCIQYRMLNTGKGPAVQSIRAQADRRKYQEYIKHTLEKCENLSLFQAEIVEILVEDRHVRGVVTATGAIYEAKAVILATGTFLNSRIIIGTYTRESGPDGLFSSVPLAKNLKNLGIELRRFKTGSPPRISRLKVDLKDAIVQPGDPIPTPFSFSTATPPENSALCHLLYTNEKTHELIRQNLHLSPMYSGDIKGTGARYCPSIEDKVVRFADKPRHQLFLEPTGMNTEELYLQGLSSSLPEAVQLEMLRTLPGFERAELMRPGYAIEYECIDPLMLLPSLEFKTIGGLYGAGQFNGTSGYEEAAAQGLMAGINAARAQIGVPPVVISRGEAYIGALIDDLVTKGTNEPYRMMTSRSEYRLYLRQDNADIRLLERAKEIGLASKEALSRTEEKISQIQKEISRLEDTILPPSDELNELISDRGENKLTTGTSLANLLRRPGIHYDTLTLFDTYRPGLSREVEQQAEISLKYDGYIKKELLKIERFTRMEEKELPPNIDYLQIPVLRLEARQKFDKIRPRSLGQASRISGVSPADMAALMIWLESRKKQNDN